MDDKGVGVEEDGLSKEGEVPHVELGAGGAPLAQFGGVLRPEVVLPARDAWAHHLVACDLGHLANLPGSAAQQLTDASGAPLWPDDFGFLDRLGRACPAGCSAASLNGGPFTITEEQENKRSRYMNRDLF